jgi:hypothetical protein
MCGNTTTSRNGSSGSWVGAVSKDVVVMASPIKKPVHDVGASSRNTSPNIDKNPLTPEQEIKKPRTILKPRWLCDVSL